MQQSQHSLSWMTFRILFSVSSEIGVLVSHIFVQFGDRHFMIQTKAPQNAYFTDQCAIHRELSRDVKAKVTREVVSVIYQETYPSSNE